MAKRRVVRESVVQPQDQSIRYIPLTQGQIAKVSAHRFEDAMRFNWQAWWSPLAKSFYAKRTERYPDGTRRDIYMSRYFLGLFHGDRREVDHQNHDTLDNTDENLRIATRNDQCHNIRLPRHNTSGFKGVSFKRASGDFWCANIRVNGRLKQIGRFPFTEGGRQAAACAYDAAALEHFGEFAHLNFPQSKSP